MTFIEYSDCDLNKKVRKARAKGHTATLILSACLHYKSLSLSDYLTEQGDILFEKYMKFSGLTAILNIIITVLSDYING